MIGEQWRVVNINDAYEVSNLGRVRRRVSGRISGAKPRSDGYITVMLAMPDGCAKRFYVHRLVAAAFCGGIPDGMEINHINFCKHDNRADNLEAVTRLENSAHSKRAGHFVNHGNNSPRGEQSPHSKLTLKDVLAIRKLAERGIRHRPLARQFGVSNVQIKNIILRKSWATT